MLHANTFHLKLKLWERMIQGPLGKGSFVIHVWRERSMCLLDKGHLNYSIHFRHIIFKAHISNINLCFSFPLSLFTIFLRDTRQTTFEICEKCQISDPLSYSHQRLDLRDEDWIKHSILFCCLISEQKFEALCKFKQISSVCLTHTFWGYLSSQPWGLRRGSEISKCWLWCHTPEWSSIFNSVSCSTIWPPHLNFSEWITPPSLLSLFLSVSQAYISLPKVDVQMPTCWAVKQDHP